MKSYSGLFLAISQQSRKGKLLYSSPNLDTWNKKWTLEDNDQGKPDNRPELESWIEQHLDPNCLNSIESLAESITSAIETDQKELFFQLIDQTDSGRVHTEASLNERNSEWLTARMRYDSELECDICTRLMDAQF